jgi:hypothetical protein
MMPKKVVFIVPNLPDNAPYLSYYIDVIDRVKCSYDIICWNRNNRPNLSYNLGNNVYVYNEFGDEKNNFLRKLFDFFGFGKFTRNILSKNSYDYVIVCNIAIGIFIYRELLFNYNNRYVFDIRDYSPIVKYFPGKLARLVNCSALNVISSQAYLTWLPRNAVYVVSHNVSKLNLLSSLQKNSCHDFRFNYPLKILTIGQIRDFNANKNLIINLGLNEKYKLLFSGDGIDKFRLQQFVHNGNYNNCFFSGRYDKSEEHTLVNNCDFINILLPEKDFVMTQMTNRFYLGLICRKPIIVNQLSYQSSFVNNFKLGLSMNLSENYESLIKDYINNFDRDEFDSGINRIIEIILEEINIFEGRIIELFDLN